MKKIILDGSKMKTREELHQYLINKLGLPDYYGNNLDALWDVISTFDRKTKIKLVNPQALSKNLGDYGDSVIEMFKQLENQTIEEEKLEMKNERYEKGVKKIQDFTLHHSPENPTGEMEIGEGFKDLAPDLSKYVVEFAFGDIYARPGLDDKQKVLVTMAGLVAQGLPQIQIHINSGLNVGLTPEEIVASIIHLLPYTGFPKVLNALKVAQKVFNDRGISLEK